MYTYLDTFATLAAGAEMTSEIAKGLTTVCVTNIYIYLFIFSVLLYAYFCIDVYIYVYEHI